MDTEVNRNWNALSENTNLSNPSITAVQASETVDDNNILTHPEPVPLHKRGFILEPLVLLVYFSINFTGAVYQNQLLYQSCVVVYNYSEEECQPLLGVERETSESNAIEKQVTPFVVQILLVRSLIESIIPAVLSLFMGPWSDKYGRRPIILSTVTGYTLFFVILTVMAGVATRTAFSPWLYLIASGALALAGGSCSFITAIFAYIADVAEGRDRAKRFLINEASLAIGTSVGGLVCGKIYGVTNVLTIFALSAVLMLAALSYVYFFVKESLPEKDAQTGGKIRSFFDVRNVANVISTCLKQREGYNRTILWVILFTSTMVAFIIQGQSTVNYLSLRLRFGWTAGEYSIFTGLGTALQVVLAILATIFLKKKYQVSNVSMALIGLVASLLESLMKALATNTFQMYISLCLGFMGGILTPMLRSIMSLVAPVAEIGKIFALTTAMETISPLGSGPLYTAVFNATLSTMPGLFNFISMGLYGLCLLLVGTVYWKIKSLGMGPTMF